jgi:Ca2+-binding EF-hand superfamily protein
MVLARYQWNLLKTDTGKINFDGFSAIASDILDEEDDEAMQKELRDAFRLYDKEGKSHF